MKAKIVEEVRAVREAYAVRFDYNLTEIFRDLKAKESAHKRNMAQLSPVEPSLNRLLKSKWAADKQG